MKTLAYIDGTNLLTEMQKELDLNFRPENPPGEVIRLANDLVYKSYQFNGIHPYRRYWFGSYKGSDQDELRIRTDLRLSAGMDAVLFKRRENKEKGVDISLTKEMLANAFRRNCERSYLFAGDEDYVSLVEETKRCGQIVIGYFFSASMSPRLILALDAFVPIDQMTKELNFQNSLRDCRAALPVK